MSADFALNCADVPSLPQGLLGRQLGAPEVGAEIPQELMSYVRAVDLGFYDKWLSDKELRIYLEAQIHDAKASYGVYFDDSDTSSPTQALQQLGWDRQMPVGTWVDYIKTLNAGGAQPLPASLITDVTVHPSVRRRGVLRHMATRGLHRAISQGLPIAALYASEGEIYGRFGFGPAVRSQSVEVNLRQNAGSQFALRPAPVGQVLPMDPTATTELTQQLWAQYHAQTRGSVDRQYAYWNILSARWSPTDPTSWNRALRAAAHIREDGSIGGAIWYTPPSWEAELQTVEIRNIIATDPVSERELWRFVASLDMVHRITWSSAPLNSAIPYAAKNPRSYQVKGVQDSLWLRILDPVACLEGREYGADGEFSLEITDPLGICAGVFTVSVSAGIAQVSPTESATSPQHFTLDAQTLASVYLGDVSVLTMAQAGRITADEQADFTSFSATWDLPTTPHCATSF